MGPATLRQTVAPFNEEITKFGEYAPKEYNNFVLTSVTQDPDGLNPVDLLHSVVQEKFAPAQFHDYSDSDKLSKPSYVDTDGGFTIAPDLVKLGSPSTKTIVYEQKLFGPTSTTALSV